MKLFVGLGNPGGKYARHRHNVGFMAVERIAERHGFSPWRKRFQGMACDGDLDGTKVLLLNPTPT
jgi:PTH1 family peptidyl-tRNA hydrolase